MDTVLVATPISYCLGSDDILFSNGTTIGKVPNILWEENFLKRCMAEQEWEDLSQCRRWLSISENVEDYHDDSLYDKVRRAMYALQIISPRGERNLYIRFRKAQLGLSITGSFRPMEMHCPSVANMALPDIEDIRNNFEKVNRGVNRVFDEQIVRLVNPIVLLEHGLQINHLYLSTLMWAMALDMLFMAREKGPFSERLAGFLGRSALVFPRCVGNFQPDLTVGSIAEDIFKLRNVIGHGQKIPRKPFLEKTGLVNTNRECHVSAEYQGYSYCEILRASALFLLVSSLRKIMVDDLIDETKDDSKWKQKLKIAAKLGRESAISILKSNGSA